MANPREGDSSTRARKKLDRSAVKQVFRGARENARVWKLSEGVPMSTYARFVKKGRHTLAPRICLKPKDGSTESAN
jgi:hypothetical protein